MTGRLSPTSNILVIPQMSPVLPFEIIAEIIDNVGENKDTSLLKELALVSHSFYQICSKHLFATVELHDTNSICRSSKKGFVNLLKSRPDIVKHIRKFTYKVGGHNDHDDNLLSPILPNYLRTIPRLSSLTIYGAKLEWNALDSFLTSALLYLMHLPTINHIDLSFIQDFPLSSLPPSINLLRLHIFYLRRSNPREEDRSQIIVLSEMMPKIREFRTSESTVLTSKLLHAVTLDGRPAFKFMDLRKLSIYFTRSEDERNLLYLLLNAKSLEKLHLSVDLGQSLVGLHGILSPRARTLKVLKFTVPLYDQSPDSPLPLPLSGLCDELEAMAGHNILEALSFKIDVDGYETEKLIGSIIQNVEKVLLKPGWSDLRQVSFKISIACCLVSREESAKLSEELQSLPGKYLSHLSKLESVAFNFSASVVKCVFEH